MAPRDPGQFTSNALSDPPCVRYHSMGGSAPVDIGPCHHGLNMTYASASSGVVTPAMTRASALSDISVSFAGGAAQGGRHDAASCAPEQIPGHQEARRDGRIPAYSLARRSPDPVRRAAPGRDGLCLRCRPASRPVAGHRETRSGKSSPASGKWLAKSGPGSRHFLAADLRRATVVMSRSLPGPARRPRHGSSATSASHDADVIVCISRLAVKE